MTIHRISHSAPAGAGLASAAPGAASRPPDGAHVTPSPRPAISGPLAQLATTGRAARPAAPGAGPRPLGMAPQRLKIAGLPVGRKGAAPRPAGPLAAVPAAPVPHHAAAPASSDHDGGIAAMRASAMETIAAQNALALIQNQIAVNQAKNAVREELGKGLKSLAQ